MQKDFKAGMALGLVLVIIVVVGLSTRPGLSIKARTLSPDSAVHRKMGTPPLHAHSAGLRKETAIDETPARQVNNEQPQEIKTERFHIVRSGETLSDISRQYYGSVDKWQKILGADRLPIKEPNRLKPGTKLIIPE